MATDLFWSVLWPYIASQESGKLSVDPRDRGNWTGGEVGKGELRGTMFGISAAAFPDIDIPNVTYEQAGGLCHDKFFLHPQLRCDLLPFPVGALLCDAAWGSGPSPAARALQASVGAVQDGFVGPVTRDLVAAEIVKPPLHTLPSGMHVLMAEFVAQRVMFESDVPTWPIYKLGWTRRLTRSLALLVPYCTSTGTPS